MKKLFLAMLMASTVFSFNSCEEEDEEATKEASSTYAETHNFNGNVAGVNIHAEEIITTTWKDFDLSGYDSEFLSNLSEEEVEELKAENTVEYPWTYSNPVQGTMVYMYNYDDWDKYGEEIGRDMYVERVSTDAEGIAHFEFGDDYFEENLLRDYVFVVYDDEKNASKPATISIESGKLGEATVYTTGEKASGVKFSKFVKTYKILPVAQEAQVTVPWWSGNNKASAAFSIDIPENTVSWYCQFTCNAATEKSGLSIATDIASLIPDKRVAATASIIEKLTTPDGTEAFDFYVMDESNYYKWVNGYSYEKLRVHERVKSGIFQEYINIEPGKYYIVCHNPNYSKVYVNYDFAIQVYEE